jgi:hypothetical protein
MPTLGGMVATGAKPSNVLNAGVNHEASPAYSENRTLSFSGYQWVVKSIAASDQPIDPGPNYFSDSNQDVWVDGQGRLHLKITCNNGKWYCAEIFSKQHFGYGHYRWYVSSNIDELNENAVLGLFTWDQNPAYNHREIDVEFTRWGDQSNDDNAQFSVQPATNEGNNYTFSLEAGNASEHGFDWSNGGVSFLSLYGQPSHSTGSDSQVAASWDYNGSDTPVAGNTTAARMDLWLLSGTPPSDNKPIEVVISKFEFTP